VFLTVAAQIFDYRRYHRSLVARQIPANVNDEIEDLMPALYVVRRVDFIAAIANRTAAFSGRQSNFSSAARQIQ
jgi:hypothetical protein